MPKKLLNYRERQALNRTLPLKKRSVTDLSELIDGYFKQWAKTNERFAQASATHRGGWVYVTYDGVQKGFHSLSRLEAARYVSILQKGFAGDHFEAFAHRPRRK